MQNKKRDDESTKITLQELVIKKIKRITSVKFLEIINTFIDNLK